MPDGDLQGLNKYALVHASQRPDEKTRLDGIHEAITAYMGGRLTLAPLESNPPNFILEMGAGSGAWTEDAAMRFPEAKVLAVDLAEIPRLLPANVTFHATDLTKPFDFKPQQFDLVHARLLFINVPNGRAVLERTLHLVKPGDLLIIEDLHSIYYDDDADEVDPILTNWHTAWTTVLGERGVNHCAATQYEAVLKESGMFSEVNVKKVYLPISNQTDDPSLNYFGDTVRRTVNSVYFQVVRNVSDPRLTESMAEEVLKVVNDPSKKLRVDFYFLWARRHL